MCGENLASDYIRHASTSLSISTYLEGVEEELTVHAHFPAQALKGVWHPHKHDVVDPKHQHQHQRGLRQLPAQRGAKKTN